MSSTSETSVAAAGTCRCHPDRLGATVFVSSHILGEIEQIADHVGILHEGRLVLQGPLAPMRAGGRSLEQVFFDATRNTTAVIR